MSPVDRERQPHRPAKTRHGTPPFHSHRTREPRVTDGQSFPAEDQMQGFGFKLEVPPSQLAVSTYGRIQVEDRQPAFLQTEPVKAAKHLAMRGLRSILLLHLQLECVAVPRPAYQQVQPLPAQRIRGQDPPAAVDHPLSQCLEGDMRRGLPIVVARLPHFAVLPPELLKGMQHPRHVQPVARNPGGRDDAAAHTLLGGHPTGCAEPKNKNPRPMPGGGSEVPKAHCINQTCR